MTPLRKWGMPSMTRSIRMRDHRNPHWKRSCHRLTRIAWWQVSGWHIFANHSCVTSSSIYLFRRSHSSQPYTGWALEASLSLVDWGHFVRFLQGFIRIRLSQSAVIIITWFAWCWRGDQWETRIQTHEKIQSVIVSQGKGRSENDNRNVNWRRLLTIVS